MRPAFRFLATSAIVVLSTQALADQAGVEALAAQKSAIVERLHTKAMKALVNAAQDRHFGDYFAAPSHEEKSRLKDRIDQISLSVQSRFRVDEMCLIDPQGKEISRIVGSAVADDLADDETEAIFFRPGFAQDPRTVHVSPIYMSADADKWVVAYTTPVTKDGEKKAILHYEHGLEFFQKILNKNMNGADRFVLAVNADGWIVSDSRRPVAIARREDSENPQTYFERFALGNKSIDQLKDESGDPNHGSGTLSAGGEKYAFAYKTGHRWTIVVLEKT